METNELKKFIKQVGNTVHSMNTIAVALSLLPESNIIYPSELRISWSPSNVELSKLRARNYAERSAIVYYVESFYEFCQSIRTKYSSIFCNYNYDTNKTKAETVYDFLIWLKCIDQEFAILAELTCNWRNNIVHNKIKSKKGTYNNSGSSRALVISNFVSPLFGK